MPKCECMNCGGTGRLDWQWEQAFENGGFIDLEMENKTHEVAGELIKAGCVVQTSGGAHNAGIVSIKADGCERIQRGEITSSHYYDPRGFLPKEIIELLDRKFPR